jgi:hypothetical protein
MGKLFFTESTDPDMLEVPIARIGFALPTMECSVHLDFFRISLEEKKLVELSEDELRESRQRFAKYSQALELPEVLLSEWNAFCEENKNRYHNRLLSIPSLVSGIARRLGVRNISRPYAALRRRWLLRLENLIRCEAHRDVVLHVLEKERVG